MEIRLNNKYDVNMIHNNKNFIIIRTHEDAEEILNCITPIRVYNAGLNVELMAVAYDMDLLNKLPLEKVKKYIQTETGINWKEGIDLLTEKYGEDSIMSVIYLRKMV